MKQRVANLVLGVRKDLGMSQLEFGRAIGVSHAGKATAQYISNIERGKQGLPLKYAREFMRLADMQPKELAWAIAMDKYDQVMAELTGAQ
jgi:transcriptional regulator with XRE-family HTH domain